MQSVRQAQQHEAVVQGRSLSPYRPWYICQKLPKTNYFKFKSIENDRQNQFLEIPKGFLYRRRYPPFDKK
jgi:hypothetical protein